MIQYATGSPFQFLFMYCRVVWPTPTTLLQNHNKLNFEFIILSLCCERIPDKTFRWMPHNNKHCNKFRRNRHLPSVSISEMFTRNGKYASWPEKFSISQVKKVITKWQYVKHFALEKWWWPLHHRKWKTFWDFEWRIAL